MIGNGSATDVITAMLHGVDTLDWEQVRATFADEMVVDYTSLFGGEAETLAGEELVERWRQLLPGFDATQHLIGPVLVLDQDGDKTTCVTSVRGYHRIVDGTEANVWMVAGRYHADLVRTAGRWTITSLTLVMAYEEGDRALLERALQRVETKSGGRVSVS